MVLKIPPLLRVSFAFDFITKDLVSHKFEINASS
jgi:hypothetical protein